MAKKEETKAEVVNEEKKSDVTIHLIPEEWDGAEFITVGINGITWQINTDVDVDVPWYIAEAITNSKKDKREATRRARAKKK